MDHKPKLLELVRNKIRLKHYNFRTAQAYIDWIKRFILFHHKRHPASMGAPEIRAFLSHLAVDRKVAASARSQALSAIIFLYREILGRDVSSLGEVERAKKPECSPVVFSSAGARAVLAWLDGQHWLMASLLYGVGLCLMECIVSASKMSTSLTAKSWYATAKVKGIALPCFRKACRTAQATFGKS
jgi:site-specific recombinase XerD